MNKKLHVGNLASSVTDQQLSDKFARFGVVQSAAVAMDYAAGESYGFGLVEMADSASAEQAIKWLNFSSYEGQIMVVSFYDSRRSAH